MIGLFSGKNFGRYQGFYPDISESLLQLLKIVDGALPGLRQPPPLLTQQNSNITNLKLRINGNYQKPAV